MHWKCCRDYPEINGYAGCLLRGFCWWSGPPRDPESGERFRRSTPTTDDAQSGGILRARN